MTATYTSYSKLFIAAKVIVVPSLITMVPPVLAYVEIDAKHQFYTPIHAVVSAISVFLIEVSFIAIAKKLNAWEIANKKEGLQEQIRELVALRENESDPRVIKTINQNLQSLKISLVKITSNPR